MPSRSEADRSFVMVYTTQVVFVHGGADSSSEVRARLLVTSKMYPTVNACVRNVVGNLLKRSVFQDDVGYRRIRQCDRMSSFAVNTSEHLGCPIACTAVV